MKTFYEAGETLAEVGTRFGISQSRVEQIFRRNVIATRKNTVSKKFRRAMDARRIILSEESLVKLYVREKLSIAKVAEKLGAGCHAVRRNLQDYGVPLRPIENYNRSRLAAELLKTLYLDQNLTAAEIAERLGYSVGTIGKKLSKLGITKRGGKRGGGTGVATGSRRSPEAAAQPGPNASAADALVVESEARTVALPPLPPEFLTVDEVARKYKIHPVTLRGLIRDGTFPNAFRRIAGKIRRWMIPAADLENFIPRKKGRARSDEPVAAGIHSRGRRAANQIEISHGYGKAEIRAMSELERQGVTRAEIAARHRLDEQLVADVLDRIALQKPRRQTPPDVKEL